MTAQDPPHLIHAEVIQGIALLNDLTYRPRPMFQIYTAVSHALNELNRDFYRGETAPDFVLLKFETLDGRFPAGDDSGTLEEILTSYEVVAYEKGYLLWSRRALGAESANHYIRRGHAAFGQRIPLPPESESLWIRLSIKRSWLGALWGVLYRPVNVSMVVETDDGQSQTYRLVPTIGDAGFLVRPWLDSQDTLVETVLGEEVRRVDGVTVTVPLVGQSGAAATPGRPPRARYERPAGPYASPTHTVGGRSLSHQGFLGLSHRPAGYSGYARGGAAVPSDARDDRVHRRPDCPPPPNWPARQCSCG